MIQLPALFSRFIRDTVGNAAIVFAFSLVPLIAIVGGGIDFLRLMSIRQDIQGAVDSAMLAAGQLNDVDEAKIMLREYIEHNIKGAEFDLDDLELEESISLSKYNAHIGITVTYQLKTIFLAIVGLDTLPVSVQSVVSRQEFAPVEIALLTSVPDHYIGRSEGWWRGYGQLETVEDIIINFLTELMPSATGGNVSVNLIPTHYGFAVPDYFEQFADPNRIYFDPTSPRLMNPIHRQELIDQGNWYDPMDDVFWPPKFSNCLVLEDRDISVNNFRKRRHQIFPCGPDDNLPVYALKNIPEKYTTGLYLSNDREKVKTAAHHMLGKNDGQSLAEPVIMALKSLSPALRGTLRGDMGGLRPTNFNSDTIKVLIVIIDSTPAPSQRTMRDQLEAYGYVCRIAEENGILFYTITMELSSLPWNFSSYQQGCGERLHISERNPNFHVVFEGITRDINKLRIIK